MPTDWGYKMGTSYVDISKYSENQFLVQIRTGSEYISFHARRDELRALQEKLNSMEDLTDYSY